MKTAVVLLFLLMTPRAAGQDSLVAPSPLELGGYIRNLHSLEFQPGKAARWNSILHNRLNARWKINENQAVIAEIRNRIFLGEDLRTAEGLADGIRNPNEYFNLQHLWLNNRDVLFHSNTERLYYDYQGSKVTFRAGRQRINWGMATTWNPNDLFNSYNFLDVDYEERPGSDGLRLGYKIHGDLNAELAYAHTGEARGSIAAVKVFYNRWNYDVQVISGLYKDRLTLGLGWAGNIGDAGFKGEAQYFELDGGRFTLSVEGDYMFKNGWYVNLGVLLNDRGANSGITGPELLAAPVTPENLMPVKWTLITTVAREFNPLVSVKSSLVYSPGTNLLIFYPGLKYSITSDVDLNVEWQSFFGKGSRPIENLTNKGYVGAEWNF